MANYLARSPIYIQAIHPMNADYAELDITIVGDTQTSNYTFSKPCINNKARFEVSDIVREVIDNRMGEINSFSLSFASVSYAVQTFYQGVAHTPSTGSFTAWDGYDDTYSPYSLAPDTIQEGLLQSNNTIYAPKDFQVWVNLCNNTGSVSVYDVGSTYEGYIEIFTGTEYQTIRVIRDCSMYEPLQIAFINKFGVKQQLFINRKSVKGINVSSDGYKSGMYDYTNGTAYTDRPIHKFNVNGRERITGSTGYVDDEHAEVIKQLLLSEQVWLGYRVNPYQTKNVPVSVTTSNVTYMNSLNDKLSNYTLEFEMAFNAVRDIR